MRAIFLPPKNPAGRQARWIFLVGLVGLVAWVDFVTDDEIRMYVFYFIPLALAACWDRRVYALLLAVLATGAWAISSVMTHNYAHIWHLAWNTVIHLVTSCGIVLLTAAIASQIRRQRRLNAELREALDQAKVLRGMLPMCAWCKKIRNDAGYWQQVETYIAEHSEAEFTHGICPECAKKALTQASQAAGAGQKAATEA